MTEKTDEDDYKIVKIFLSKTLLVLPRWFNGKESAVNAGDPCSIPGSGRFPWRRNRLPTPVFLSFPCVSAGKESACNAGDLGWEDPLEKGTAAHSSILAWRIPWTV